MINLETSIIRILKDIYETYGKVGQLDLLRMVEKRLELEQNRTPA